MPHDRSALIGQLRALLNEAEPAEAAATPLLVPVSDGLSRNRL